jgi:hypothetical protein
MSFTVRVLQLVSLSSCLIAFVGYTGNYVRGATIRKLRTAKDAVKGKLNSLTGLLQLPLEVLYDVLELAHPMDLLHLSRSSKALRSIILSKQAENVWKNAYDHYHELPRPPKELSPPKWTAMMFDDSKCDVSHSFPSHLSFQSLFL